MIAPQKRLALFVPSLVGGGAERMALTLVQGMTERGYSMDLVLAQGEGSLITEVPDSVRVVDLKGSRVLTSLPNLVMYLRSEKCEAMLSLMSHANIVALWARKISGASNRVVVTEVNTLSSSVRNSPNVQARLMPYLTRTFYPWADDIIANSKGVGDDLAQVTGIPRKRIKVIYQPVVTSQLQAQLQAPIEHPWFKTGELPVLLGAGRLTAQKDFPLLIRAFAEVRKTRPSRLVILGEGEDRSTLESLVTRLGIERDVDMPGFVKNPCSYIARASVFILTSRWEGLPTVLVAALYCGTPIVSTDCPSGPREILKNGQYGYLVPVGEMTALVQAIESTLDGKTLHPPWQSWRAFEFEYAVNRYLNTLIGSE